MNAVYVSEELPWVPALLVVLVTWSLAGISVNDGGSRICIILASARFVMALL